MQIMITYRATSAAESRPYRRNSPQQVVEAGGQGAWGQGNRALGEHHETHYRRVRRAPRCHALIERVNRLREGVDARGEAVELRSSSNEWCSWQSAKGSGCPAGKPSANGT